MSHLRIAHLSDPHFGTIPPGVLDGLMITLSDIKPDLILLTGDITQRARASQFREAFEFAQRWSSVPFVAVPGNHDIPLFNIFGRLFHPYRGYQQIFQQSVESQFQNHDIVVTALNSTSRWRHVQGKLNLDRIKQKFSKNLPASKKVHILAFHHPMDCIKPQDEKTCLSVRQRRSKCLKITKLIWSLAGTFTIRTRLYQASATRS